VLSLFLGKSSVCNFFSILYKQVEAEKPNPTIFLKACDLLDVKPEEAVHVGDDRRNDVWGARDAGCDAWLWGSDVYSFKEVFLFFSIPTLTILFSWKLFQEQSILYISSLGK
jgi:beta-phosphoglucomutase-like phosphatase (HAD superfamily)